MKYHHCRLNDTSSLMISNVREKDRVSPLPQHFSADNEQSSERRLQFFLSCSTRCAHIVLNQQHMGRRGCTQRHRIGEGHEERNSSPRASFSFVL
mmetsp:Transcript_8971/g.17099  ORF Transcript_8971/g.17099 Transcript_8971/m.17099 type:complete len:95 (+) Transcript_8971:97-381(+)